MLAHVEIQRLEKEKQKHIRQYENAYNVKQQIEANANIKALNERIEELKNK